MDYNTKSGGLSLVHRNAANEIDFVGFMSPYAVAFVESELFWPVVQLDTRHQRGISHGNLYTIVASTGDRTIIPLVHAWAESEKKEYTLLLLKMIEKYIPLLFSCLSDEGVAIVPALEENNIPSLSCLYHLKLKARLEDRKILNELALASTPDQYYSIKENIISHHSNLAELLNIKFLSPKTRWEKISVFESLISRDYFAASVLSEAYNSTFKRPSIMKWEPLSIFCKVHCQILNVLEEIANQNPDRDGLTESAHHFLAASRNVADNTTVQLSPDCSSDYICTNAFGTCIVHYNPKTKGDIPTCTCLQHQNGGFPCPHMISFANFRNLNPINWIHKRYFVNEYRNLLENVELVYFPSSLVTCRTDKPSIIKPLGRKEKRLKSKGEVVIHRKRKGVPANAFRKKHLIHHKQVL